MKGDVDQLTRYIHPPPPQTPNYYLIGSGEIKWVNKSVVKKSEIRQLAEGLHPFMMKLIVIATFP